jgi:diacylglycerol kinase family enzyme
VCVPFGTRNHFARDLGLDVRGSDRALAAFDGEERRVDIGRVRRRWFVNNVSLGLYASFVHDPARKTRNRLVALLRMLPAAFGRSRTPSISRSSRGRREHHSALVVLVANNAYAMRDMADLGRRETLDEGELHAYVIEAVSRRALLGLLARGRRQPRARRWMERVGGRALHGSRRPATTCMLPSTVSPWSCPRRSSSRSGRALCVCCFPPPQA